LKLLINNHYISTRLYFSFRVRILDLECGAKAQHPEDFSHLNATTIAEHLIVQPMSAMREIKHQKIRNTLSHCLYVNTLNFYLRFYFCEEKNQINTADCLGLGLVQEC
jgi:hypothetical protein